MRVKKVIFIATVGCHPNQENQTNVFYTDMAIKDIPAYVVSRERDNFGRDRYIKSIEVVDGFMVKKD